MYAERIRRLLNSNGKILLVGLDYVQNEMQGPPFSVPEEEVFQLFSGMTITRLKRDEAKQATLSDKMVCLVLQKKCG